MALLKNNYPDVIVRAWADEPVRLVLYRIENKRCYVGLKEAKHPIGLPVNQVFVFKEGMFSTMLHSFKSGNIAELRCIYDRIPVEDFACNKYQDNLEYSHDQENVTDSGRAPNSDTE